MNRMEYLVIHVDEHDWVDSAGQSGRLAELRRGEKWGDLAPLLNQLGREGWDLAGVLNSDDSWEVPARAQARTVGLESHA